MTGTGPRFSVIVPTFERPKALRRCLEGFTRIDHPSWELIVVNDGGASSFEAVDGELGARLPLRLLENEHAGPAAARNRGARAAKGSFLAFTDDDCVPEPDWLTELEKGFRDEGTAVLGGDWLNPYPDAVAAETWQLYMAFLREYLRDLSGNFLMIPSNNVAYRSEVFWSVGGFDESFPSAAGEDVDLGYRIVERGYRQLYRETAKVWHHHRTTVGSYLRQQYRYGKGTSILRTRSYALRLPRRRIGEQQAALLGFLRRRRVSIGVLVLAGLTPLAHRAGVEAARLSERRAAR